MSYNVQIEQLCIFDISCFSLLLISHLIILVSYSSMTIRRACGNQTYNHSATNREGKLSKTLFIVTVVSLLLTLPWIIIFKTRKIISLPTYSMISRRTFFRLRYSFFFLCYTNSLFSIQFLMH